ncbi:MAG: NAD-dependent epimerase/dehydratase family protein [Planctomycetaceae bacterium]
MSIPSPVLVTGGAGYVGSALISRLLSLGGTVRGFDWNPPPAGLDTSSSRLSWMEGDIREPGLVRQALTGCRSVVHLASIADAPTFDIDPGLARSINVEGLRCVLAEAALAGVEPLVLVTHTPDPQSRGFHRMEMVREDLADQARARGLAVATIRVPTLCGWSPRMRFDLPVNAAIAREFATERDATPDKAPLPNSLHLDDLVDLLVLLQAWPPASTCGGVWEVSSTDISGSSTNHPATTRNPVPSNDEAVRSLVAEFGWSPRRSPGQARSELRERLSQGEYPDALSNPAYHNADGQRNGPSGRNRSAA